MSETSETRTPSLVVGIGASAGGLSVIRDLLSGLSASTGAAYVVVMHLAPDHDSHLPDLLQMSSPMPVVQVTDDVMLEADHVYVIPPNRKLSAIDTHLRPRPLDDNPTSRHLIDHFFRTLADVHDGHSVGIVLSGSGSDGSSGLSMIQGRGGLTIAQEPSEAEYADMPRNAILADAVDLVLPVAEISERIVELARSSSDMPAGDVADAVEADGRDAELREILTVVREHSGHDFSGYKETTVRRRMQRRIQLHRRTDLADYLGLLRNSPDEIDLLFNDLLIPVTNFFRDPETFEALDADVVPGLFEGKERGDPVRVWSVGCSTGEEAYSVAMLLLEHASTLSWRPQIQVFASDLHDPSLERARRGVYPATIESDVSTERLERFFDAVDGGYSVADELRQIVVFAHHDLLSDPPFSHMDLVLCRNMLIYLKPEAQHHALGTLHYALEPGGVLVLGSSETTQRSDTLHAIDKRHGFFRRRDLELRPPPMTVFRRQPQRAASTHLPQSTSLEAGDEQLHRSLLEKFGPPSLLVDASNRVVHFSAGVGRFLVHPDGAPTGDVFELLDDGLRIELRSVMFSARRTEKPAASRPMTVVIGQTETTVVLRVVPVSDEGLVLVMFDPVPPSVTPTATVDGETVANLAKQLDEANRHLDSAITEYERGQDEMKAANEELQSTNEELRSTMEELETSKEELQSTNEELSTLNQENRHRVEELAMLSSDLQNLLTATDIATLFLDRRLRIVRFTPPVTEIFNIVLDDRGRSITDFTDRLRGHHLAADAQRVLDRLVPIEQELLSDDDRRLLTRIMPYRTSDDRIEGVVVTFVDITRRYRAEAELRSSERALRLALDAATMGTWWWDESTGSSGGDGRAFEILGVTAEDGSFVDVLADRLGVDDRDRWSAFVGSGTDRDVEFAAIAGDGDAVVVQVNVSNDERTPAVRRGTIVDVTSRVQAMSSLGERTERLSLLIDAAAQLLRGTPPDAVLAELFDRMSEILGFEIYERYDVSSGASPRMIAGNVGGSAEQQGADTGSPLGRHACETVSDLHQPVIFDAHHRPPSPDFSTAAQREGIEAFGCFPLMDDGDVVGVLCFGTRGSARFDEPTVEVIRTVVDFVAVGAQRLHAEEELRELNHTLEARVEGATRDLRESERQLRHLASNLVSAEQAERQRIAQLLHDDVQQLLFGAQMRLGLLREDVDHDRSGAAATHLDEADRYLREGIDTTRHLSAELAPPALDDEDVGVTVRSLVEQMRKLHDLDVEVRAADHLRVPDREVRVVVHQTLRELLFNVVKHADVGHAVIELSLSADELEIHVEDGGSGFDTAEVFADPAGDKRGLATLRQRLSLVGGSLTLESIPGDGTRALVELPTVGIESEPA